MKRVHALAILGFSLAACQAPPASPPVPAPAPTQAPALAASPPPSPAASPPPTAATPPPALTLDDDPSGLAIAVGATRRLRGPGGWRLDPASAGRATIAPQPDGSCLVTATAPGAVTVLGSGVRVTLAAVAADLPARRLALSAEGLRPAAGVWALRSAEEWEAFWEASRQRPDNSVPGCVRCPAPPAPALDWARESVVLMGHLMVGHPIGPLLADVAADRVLAVLPVLETGQFAGWGLDPYVAAWAVPRLADGAAIDYQCGYPELCPPGGPSPLPSPDPFAAIRPDTLAVGHPVDLPGGWAGEPVAWAIAPRDAARASLEGRTLTPQAPGPLALTARAGGREVQVLHAVLAEAPAARLVTWTVAPLAGPRVAASAEAWRALWASFYAATNPTVPGAPTAPPPAPPAPGLPGAPSGEPVAFGAEAVVAIPLAADAAGWDVVRPVVTHVEGGTVHLVRPQLGPAAPGVAGPQVVVVALPAAEAAGVTRAVLDGLP